MVRFPASPRPHPRDSIPPNAWGAFRETPPAPYGTRAASAIPSLDDGDAEEAGRPLDDVDSLEELGDRIATLSAHIHAATHRLLVLIEEFDRRRGWELAGHRSCAHWLAARTRIDLGTAREKMRAARALADLPEMSDSMARGELSLCAVRALTRVATPQNEGDLLEAARGCTVAGIERMVRAYRVTSRKDEAALERERWENRTFSVFPDHDGMYVVKGRLPAEVAAVLMRGVEAASDALYRERPTVFDREEDTHRAAAQRRADAVGLLAERALAAGFGGSPGEGGEREGADTAPISGTRAERYQVVLHVDTDTLAGDGARAHLEDGTRLSCETSRRLCCDTAVVKVTHGGRREAGHWPATPVKSSILDVGRRTRTIPPSLRRALDFRDRGCRFPDCGLRFTDAHHVVHWADGGETSLSNTLLLCRHHHRLVHEEGWRVEWWGEGRPAFHSPRGDTHFEGRWQPPRLPENAVAALIDENTRAGARPDGWTASARWERACDVPRDVELRFAEAVD